MVDFIATLVVMAMLLGVYHWYAGKRPFDKELTWGEAMVSALFVFFVFFWVYGVVPHFWLEWADKGLNWRADRLFRGFAIQEFWGIDYFANGILADQNSGGWMPFSIPYLVLRDLIAVVIYGIAIGGNIWYWGHWQSRKSRADEAEKIAEAPSEFGRPLVREGVR